MSKDARNAKGLHSDWHGTSPELVDAAIDALIFVLFEPVTVNGETLYRVRRNLRGD